MWRVSSRRIHNETLFAILARTVRDPQLLWLTRTLLFHDPTADYRFRSLKAGIPAPGTPGYPVPAEKSLFGAQRARAGDREPHQPVLGQRVSRRAGSVGEADAQAPVLPPLRRRHGLALAGPGCAGAVAGGDRGVLAGAARAEAAGGGSRSVSRRPGRRLRRVEDLVGPARPQAADAGELEESARGIRACGRPARSGGTAHRPAAAGSSRQRRAAAGGGRVLLWAPAAGRRVAG